MATGPHSYIHHVHAPQPRLELGLPTPEDGGLPINLPGTDIQLLFRCESALDLPEASGVARHYDQTLLAAAHRVTADPVGHFSPVVGVFLAVQQGAVVQLDTVVIEISLMI